MTEWSEQTRVFVKLLNDGVKLVFDNLRNTFLSGAVAAVGGFIITHPVQFALPNYIGLLAIALSILLLLINLLNGILQAVNFIKEAPAQEVPTKNKFLKIISKSIPLVIIVFFTLISMASFNVAFLRQLDNDKKNMVQKQISEQSNDLNEPIAKVNAHKKP